MSEIIERVARAIQEDMDPDESWEHMPELRREDFRGYAIAAIEAMREPTEAMINSDSASDPNSHPGFLSQETLRHVWRCMINEALK